VRNPRALPPYFFSWNKAVEFMSKKQELTQWLIKELIHYDPKTGVFTWRYRDIKHFKSKRAFKSWNTKYAGSIAGSFRYDGSGKTYIKIGFFSKVYDAHRLAYLYMEGIWPVQIDHQDGNGTNNRWVNIKNSNNKDNRKNHRKRLNNTSGFNGVYFIKQSNKWKAEIKVNDCYEYLGQFSNIDDAISARKAANIRYGFHENHGTDRPL
jgi:hypothetical protein